MRRFGFPSNGKRFLGNVQTRQVHDLDKEKRGLIDCHIHELIVTGKAVVFDPDTLEQAHKMGYVDCPFCLS